MKTNLILVGLVTMALSAFASGCVEHEVVYETPQGEYRQTYVEGAAPPPVQVEVYGPAPWYGAVWVPGFWYHDHHYWGWHRGYWRHR